MLHWHLLIVSHGSVRGDSVVSDVQESWIQLKNHIRQLNTYKYFPKHVKKKKKLDDVLWFL